MTVESTDVLVIGSGFGGAIPAYHLAAGGAKVTILERGPHLRTEEFTHDLRLGTFTKIIDAIQCSGITVIAGNCVGGSSVAYLAASLRAPSFIFDRTDAKGRRLWPASITRATLDPWYDRVDEALPVARQDWTDVSYAGGVFAAACRNAGRTCNPNPVAVDLTACTNCGWMMNGCQFGAKRSMLLNYLPAAESHGAKIRPLHEVQHIARRPFGEHRYRIHYRVISEQDYTQHVDQGLIDAKIVVLAAGTMGTPVILKRSQVLLGGVPHAVGRHFSGNGDRVSVARLHFDRVRDVLGLPVPPEIPDAAMHIGKAINTISFDNLKETNDSRFSLQQIDFPPTLNYLAQSPEAPGWFGLAKRELRESWRSWLTVLAMTEDDNEGVFGTPPPHGNFTRIALSGGIGPLNYDPSDTTLAGWAAADRELRDIVERDGLSRVMPWTEQPGGVLSAHPLASCRLGDDDDISALTEQSELRGSPGLFVTDGAAVPTALCVNPSLTIAALAERACPGIVDRAKELGVEVQYGAPSPSGETNGRRAVLPIIRST